MIEQLVNGYNETKEQVRQRLMGMTDEELYNLNYKGLYAVLLEEMTEANLWEGFYKEDDIADAWLGSYQGNMFVIFQDHYEREAYCTYVQYGSCSVCDTFLSAIDNEDRAQAVNDLLTLLLHMVQNTKYLHKHLEY